MGLMILVLLANSGYKYDKKVTITPLRLEISPQCEFKIIDSGTNEPVPYAGVVFTYFEDDTLLGTAASFAASMIFPFGELNFKESHLVSFIANKQGVINIDRGLTVNWTFWRAKRYIPDYIDVLHPYYSHKRFKVNRKAFGNIQAIKGIYREKFPLDAIPLVETSNSMTGHLFGSGGWYFDLIYSRQKDSVKDAIVKSLGGIDGYEDRLLKYTGNNHESVRTYYDGILLRYMKIDPVKRDAIKNEKALSLTGVGKWIKGGTGAQLVTRDGTVWKELAGEVLDGIRDFSDKRHQRGIIVTGDRAVIIDHGTVGKSGIRIALYDSTGKRVWERDNVVQPECSDMTKDGLYIAFVVKTEKSKKALVVIDHWGLAHTIQPCDSIGNIRISNNGRYVYCDKYLCKQSNPSPGGDEVIIDRETLRNTYLKESGKSVKGISDDGTLLYSD